MGRRRKGKSVEVKLLIPESVYFRFERAITSGFKKAPEYGVRSQVITQLITRWLDSIEKPSPTQEHPHGPDEPEPQRPQPEAEPADS